MGSRTDSFRFATSANRETDEYYKAILERIAAFFEKDFEGKPSSAALVLSGSLAVAEGTSYGGGGKIEPGSDVDLYLVVPESDLPAWQGRLPGLHRALLDSIAIPGLVIDLGATSPRRLVRLTPTIANCVLTGEGRTIAGDAGLVPRGEALSCADIPPWDGLLLLLNRTAEELAELNVRPRGTGEDRAFWYRFGKTIRDLGTSALAVAGDFAPRLEERRQRLPRLLARSSLAEAIPSFPEEFDFWCGQKGRPSVKEATERYGGEERAHAAAHARKRRCVEAFWTWETAEVAGRGDAGEDIGALRVLEPAPRRAKAWLRFLAERRGAALGGALRHARRGWPVTPLLGNYVAAVCLLRCWGHVAGERLSETDRRLLARARWATPVEAGGGRSSFDGEWRRLREAVCRLWSDEVMGGTRPPKPLERT